MNKTILGLILLAVLCACQSSDDPVLPFNRPSDIELTRSEMEMVEVGNEFAFNLFQQVNSDKTGKDNPLISPLSASLALSMVANGADGATLTEMKKVLGFDSNSIDELNSFYYKMAQGIQKADLSVELGLANSIWIHNEFPVLNDFKAVNHAMYDAEVNGLDFFRPDAKDVINQWASNKTKDKIKEVIQEIHPDTRVFLLNALYFQGNWKYEFNEKLTAKKAFTNAGGSEVQVDMMNMECALNYTADSQLQIAELPYGNESFSMVLLLPQADNTLDDVIGALTPEKWGEWMQGLERQTLLDVQLPKFKVEYDRSMKDDLLNMGMVKAFSPKEADFSKMASEPLFISLVNQFTYIDVYEKGTEAAAVTVIGMDVTTSLEPPVIVPTPFHVDRPFMYVIKEKSTGAILFMGKVDKL